MVRYLKKIIRKSSFTLTELLFVIAIIAVLVALIVPVAQTAFEKMRIHQTEADISSLEVALESYKSKYGVYPDASPAQRVPVGSCLDEFMKFPAKRVRSNIFYDSWNNAYRYSKPGTNQTDFVDIASAGPDGLINDANWMTNASGDNADNLTNWSKNR